MTKSASYTQAEELPLASYIAGNMEHKTADLAKKTRTLYFDGQCVTHCALKIRARNIHICW